MKSFSEIVAALWLAWLRPVSYLEKAPQWTVLLLLLGRVAVAVFPGIPSTLISGMASDSGTPLALQAAFVLMFSIFMLAVCAPLLWSWRCAAAGIANILAWFLLANLCKNLDQQSRHDQSPAVMRKIHIVIAISTMLLLVITEGLARPIRKLYHFAKWCMDDEGIVTWEDDNRSAFSPVPLNDTGLV